MITTIIIFIVFATLVGILIYLVIGAMWKTHLSKTRPTLNSLWHSIFDLVTPDYFFGRPI